MISIRDMASQDKETVRQWRNLPEISKYMYTDHTITEEEHSQWFDRVAKDARSRYWMIVLDDRDVGVANLYNIDRQNFRAHWAFYLADPAVRGRGVGGFVEHWVLRHVFDELQLNKLCCEVFTWNKAVVNMHKSFGFVEEGLFREHIVKQGKALDIVCLAMLRREWDAVRPEIEERLRGLGLLG